MHTATHLAVNPYAPPREGARRAEEPLGKYGNAVELTVADRLKAGPTRPLPVST
ncbi:hypothetical protein ACIQU4_19815 [Streptomyces sp. NPDC090741]|uniref:hypothetical protein n=1 Tax=Streptomyces sp. NPDC090741 TaxID=3365967 RepID=UPI00381D8BEC